jgi:flagellar hook-associated protein 2
MSGLQTIEGLISNLDTSSIISAIMKAEREPVTLLEEDLAKKTNQVAAYQAVLAKFLALQTNSAQLKDAGSFNKTSVNVSDSDVLTATAKERVASGTYSIRVLSLAKSHQLASQGYGSASEESFGTGTIKLSVGNASLKTIDIKEGNNSLIGIKNAINNANVGITASIINDGSSSNAYRLLLTSNKSGAVNDINFEVSLSGGETLDLTNSSFDSPEELSFSAGSTSNVTLGATASYTGSNNKTYTFTVGGAGKQTIGTDNITINWTDGTNSGSILVTQADTEYELLGDGSDGLKLMFSSGDLVAGDTFQVQTFAPLLQAASDARIAIGADDGEQGSAITINSSTNTFDSVISGLSVEVKKVSEPGTSVTINTTIDVDAVQSMISDFIDRYNAIMEYVDEQNTYHEDSEDAGALFSDLSLQVMQSSLRAAATSVVAGLTGEINMLASIGIRSNADGLLKIADASALTNAIRNNYEDIVRLFTDSGKSSSSYIEFLSANEKTVAGEYEVEITQAATKGYLQGLTIANPSVTPLTLTDSNNLLKFRVDGLVSGDLALTAKTYNTGEELADEIQTRINADSKLGDRGITVEWVDLGNTGYLKITSGSYGSKSKVEAYMSIANTAFSALGLSNGMVKAGLDVAGTINGETATGSGQILTGKEGNNNTEGLRIKVSLTSGDLASGAEGTISVVKGLASKVDETLERITDSVDGSIARRIAAINEQMENIKDQIENWDERLAKRQEYLYEKFAAMEEALSEYQTAGTYLEAQLKSITNNYSLTGNSGDD